MIQLQNLTPKVYYNESRDFQLIGRLYDAVLNSVKTNVDLIYNLPLNDDSTEDVTTLLALSFGFKPKHNYSVKQLKSLLSVFNYAIRNKGSLESIEVACNALLRSEGISQTIAVEQDQTDIFNYLIYISAQLTDITLLQDFLDYILPAGITYTLIKELKVVSEGTTITGTNDAIKYWAEHTVDFSSIPKITNELGQRPIANMHGTFANGTIIKSLPTSKEKVIYNHKEENDT